jgi:uncharacterized protein YndB with AHSA1/START domain
MNTEPIIVERMLQAPVSKVWEAITDKDKMKQWYFDLPEFRPEVGCAFQFHGGPSPEKQYLHLCVVTEVAPGSKITYSWRYDGYTGISYVTFELFPDGEQTKILLTHRGLETFPADVPELGRHNFEGGWNHIINISLPGFVE